MNLQIRSVITNRGYCAEAQKYFAAMTVKPPGQVGRKLSDALYRLQQGHLWNKFDLCYFRAVHHSQAALINARSPGAFTATAVNSPAFAVLRGYTGDASTNYLNLNWTPGSQGVNFLQNNAHVALWSAAQLAGQTGCAAGTTGAANIDNTTLFPRYTDNNAYCRINETILSGGFANTKTTGLFCGGRSSSTARDFSLNGVALGTYGSQASVVASPNPMFELANNAAGSPGDFSSYTSAFLSTGGYLIPNEQRFLFGALKPYMDFAGVPS